MVNGNQFITGGAPPCRGVTLLTLVTLVLVVDVAAKKAHVLQGSSPESQVGL